ncbi:MAG: hypothetical protein WC637_18425 [Victivallales bacterium]
MNRPNILYIHSHDTGRYIQPYGHAIATPCLQRLAEETGDPLLHGGLPAPAGSQCKRHKRSFTA